ncbi:MAG: hypothetical protein V4857_14215 [Pseudomonadota bacterium]
MDEPTQAFIGMLSGGVFALIVAVLYFAVRGRGTRPVLAWVLIAALTIGYFKALFVVDALYFEPARTAAVEQRKADKLARKG